MAVSAAVAAVAPAGPWTRAGPTAAAAHVHRPFPGCGSGRRHPDPGSERRGGSVRRGSARGGGLAAPPQGGSERGWRAVVATHPSRDHHGGLVDVLDRFPVDVLFDGGDGTRDAGFRAVEREADHLGIRRVIARAGTGFAVGSIGVRVLSPPPRPPGPPPRGPEPARHRGGGQQRRLRAPAVGRRRERGAAAADAAGRGRHEGAAPRKRRPGPSGGAGSPPARGRGDRGGGGQHLRPPDPVHPPRPRAGRHSGPSGPTATAR